MSFTALVLAGSRGGDDPLARHAGVSDKALIEFNGETMLTRVVAALREAGAGRIAVSFSSEAVFSLCLRIMVGQSTICTPR